MINYKFVTFFFRSRVVCLYMYLPLECYLFFIISDAIWF